jgi:hypothetical protein
MLKTEKNSYIPRTLDEIIDYERDFKKAQKGDSEQVNTKGY